MLARILAVIFSLHAPQTADTPFTVEQYLKLRQLSDVAASPDGGQVAFTGREADADANEYRVKLYLWSAGSTRPLTSDFANAYSPRWSTDGAMLSFLSSGRSTSGGESLQIWIIRHVPQAAASQLGNLPSGVLEYGWAPGDLIYALTANEDGGREFWRVNVADATAEFVWGGDSSISGMAVSPDGGSIVFSANSAGAAGEFPTHNLRVLDLDSRRSRELTSRPGSEIAPAWSPDGRSVVFRAPQSPSHPHSQMDLFVVDVARRTLQNLTDSFDRAVLDHRWPSGGDVLFTAAVGTETHLFALRGSGSIELVSGGEYNVGDFDAVAAGTPLYAIRESDTEAAELWKIGDTGAERLSLLNDHARRWRLARQEVIRWQAPDGLTVEGLLVYPADYEEGRRYPLLVDADGGPLHRVRNVLDQPASYQLFASYGYALLATNYRGSSGYGESFGTARRADLAGGDLVDLLSGIDHVIALGVADATRLAIFGGCRGVYGAHLATWAITRTRRFKAALAVYGSVTSDSPAGAYGANPAGAPTAEGYLELLESERSPLDSIASVRTPLLALEGDTRTLVSRPLRLYNALNELGRPVEHVVLATAGTPWTPRDQSDVFFRQLRWFDKYLKFGGADLFDFYLVGEWVPGPGGWRMRVESAETRSDYSGLRPESGRYLEIDLSLEPSEAALRDGTLQDFELDPGAAVALIAPDSTPRPFAGTVTEFFGLETLVMGLPSTIRIVATGPGGAPTALATKLAFEVPEAAAEYRLSVTGFVPIRIWVAGND